MSGKVLHRYRCYLIELVIYLGPFGCLGTVLFTPPLEVGGGEASPLFEVGDGDGDVNVMMVAMRGVLHYQEVAGH